MILPTKLQEKAIQIAHKGAHPGQQGLKRRLRYNFFFHGMDKKVEEFVKSCSNCNVFVDKKTKEPIKPHRVPEKCWETVVVDLFGPMPSSKHVVAVQDLASRYPAAKLITSTKADKVIPALTEIYETYGNQDVQISDNGPPFNSIQMQNFAKTTTLLEPSRNLYAALGQGYENWASQRYPRKRKPKKCLEKLQTDTSLGNQSSTGSYDFPPWTTPGLS
ncbi:Retrovirus-related Pol poly from transposon [Paramuricea clavata]|uniref:Retrovirus-related Pol poly from transposon n=1 Tax=Paramuricea clavata TaxID=317549 RepID=A0A6S7K634_PARCT|nr:Retrovirus-related Pol poly from transposon [Paramuricea clavata]